MSRTALALVIALAAPAPAADLPADIPALVKALGADGFDDRQAAEKALVKLGAKAVPALQTAARSDDPEVAFRAKRALAALEWVLPDGTPEDVAALIRRYQDASTDRRATLRVPVFEAAARAGKVGVPALQFMAQKASPGRPDAAVQREVLWAVRRAVPRLLLAHREADAQAVLDAALDLADIQQAAADYAAFEFDRGRATQVLTGWEKQRVVDGSDAKAGWVLLNLYRMQGDRAKAEGLAGKLSDAARAVLLADAGEWGKLADRLGPNVTRSERLLVFRLAGRTKELDEAVRKALDRTANPWNPNEPPGLTVQALLLAGRADDADKVCVDRDGWPGVRLQIAAARFRIADALALPGGPAEVESLKKNRPEQWKGWQIARTELLVKLGRKKEAADALAAVAKEFPAKPEEGGPGLQLVSLEMAAGLTDEAFARGTDLIARAGKAPPGAVQPIQLYRVLFPDKAEVAGTLWDVLRSSIHNGKPPAETVGLTRRLLTGTATADEAAAVLDALRKAAPGNARREAVIAVALPAGRLTDAEPVLRETAEQSAGTPASPNSSQPVEPWLAWGKCLADLGRDRDAAAAYLRGWEQDPDAAILLYRSGMALIRAGDQAEGTHRIEVAFRGVLGNEAGWAEFLDHLNEADTPPADRKRAADAVGRVFWGRGSSSITAVRRALAYRGAGDWAATARAWDRAMYEFTTAGNTFFPDLWRYYRLPAWTPAFRAHALLDAGKPAEAAAEVRAYLQVAPDDASEVCRLVPKFDKAGAKAEADGLFRAAWEPLMAVLKDHPDSAYYHNDAAWLAANSRRELDAALAHARKAVELSPDDAAFQDTLAEVHFRRGEQAEAVKVMTRLVEQTKGRKAYFRKQLARFKAGDVTSPPADED